MYALWAKNDYHYYFDKVDGNGGASASAQARANRSSSNGEVKVIDAEDFN